MRKNDIEEQHQIAIVNWSKYQKLNPLKHSVLPGSTIFDYLYAIPNGGFRTKGEAGRLKAQGVKSGIPDLHLPIPCGSHNSLYIELKKPKIRGDKSPPKVSDSQKIMMERLSKANNLCVVCYGQDEAITIIKMYLAGQI